MWRRVAKVVSLSSEFPEEIFSEMESPTWESHNTALGSYQTITPAILHLIHPYLTSGLSFAEYAVIKSAFQNTFLDSLFIHAQKEVLNSSSYLNLLLSDTVLEEKIVVIEVDFEVAGADELNLKQIVSAGLRAVTSFGGFYLKPGVIFLNDITSLLKFESAVIWSENAEYPDMIAAH